MPNAATQVTPGFLYMRFLLLFCTLLFFPFFAKPAVSQCNMRVMDTRELVLNADLIARVRVRSTKNIRNPMYGQVAVLEILEVIYGDPRRREVRVWAMSTTYCARDAYAPQQEMLVFLARDQTSFHTVNWQYGQFLVTNDIVEAWRGRSAESATTLAATRQPDAPLGQPLPFTEVKQEILTLLEEVRQSSKARRP
ncbi:MAG: hypothetical protein SNJ62_12605 [Chloracidobacterium sp.]